MDILNKNIFNECETCGDEGCGGCGDEKELGVIEEEGSDVYKEKEEVPDEGGGMSEEEIL